jgi:predicted RNA binding protein YcfA (HicA-like mRNA interferase family)
MSDFPAVSGKDAVRALKKLGFHEARTTGSHVVLKKDGNELLVTVPVHGNKSLKTGTLRGIIKGAGVTQEEFIAKL